jgi:phenylacetic acid degradation operon negative regulatory protein
MMSSDTVEQLPRFQGGARPQRLLSTLLGDYWFGRSEHLPSGALVDLLGHFGVTESGARAAIQRLAHRGFLVAARQGRQTAYAVSSRVLSKIEESSLLIFEPPFRTDWDGRWTVVAFTVPEIQQASRRSFRDALRKRGFGSLYDAVWVSPRDQVQIALDLAAESGVTQVVALSTAELAGMSPEVAIQSLFDLTGLRRGYEAFLRDWPEESAAIDGERALATRTNVMAEWRQIVRQDPSIPRGLLPDAWPAVEAYARCALVYDSLGADAEATIRDIIRPHDAGLATLIRRHSFANWRELLDAARDVTSPAAGASTSEET